MVEIVKLAYDNPWTTVLLLVVSAIAGEAILYGIGYIVRGFHGPQDRT